MAGELKDTEIVAFFGTQMLVHLIRNLVANGIFPEAGVRTNLQESIDQATENFGPEYHARIVHIASAFEVAIAEGGRIHKQRKG